MDLRTVVQRQRELAVAHARRQPCDRAAHGLFRVVLHVLHVGLHDRQTELFDHAVQLLHALFVGRNLRLQIGHVLLRIARGELAALQQRKHLGLAQGARIDELEVVDLHALFFDSRGERWHRSRRDAAHIRVVPTAADIERGLGAVIDVHRRDHGDVRQMRAAVVRVVEHEDIAALHAVAVARNHRLDALAHRSQMHRHVRRVGDQLALAVEQGAAEIEPLLDVHRVRGVLQLQTHLLGDIHEQIVEDLEQHRIHRRAGRHALRTRHMAREQQMVEAGQLRLPTGFDHRRRILLGDDDRAQHPIAGAHVFAHHQRRVMPLRLPCDPHGKYTHRLARRHIARRVFRLARFGRAVARHHQLHRHRLDHQRTPLHQEREALAIRALERFGHLREGTERHHQGGIRPFVAHMRAAQHLRRAGFQTTLQQLGARGVFQFLQHRFDLRKRVVRQAQLERLLAHHVLVRQPHAVGREHSGQGMNQHLFHAKRIGHQTGVLPTGSAKALQGIARHVIAASDRDFLDRIRHLLHGDLDVAMRHGLSGSAEWLRKRRKFLGHHRAVQTLVGGMTEHMREIFGLELADHDVRIGHRQGPATSITGGTRIGSGAFGADAKTRTVERQNRATPRRHCVNAHHRRTHAHAGHLGLELALEFAREMADVGGGTAHVKADHAVLSGDLRGAGHAHNAAGGPRKNRVLALKAMSVRQASGRLHEVQRNAGQLGLHLLHVAPQDGREIGIHHRGVAAAHKLHQRARAMRCADLRKARLARQLRRGFFVRRVAPAVHEHNRHAAQPRVVCRPQALAQMPGVQRLDHLAGGAHAFLRFDHAAVEQLGQDDAAIEQARSVLVGNAQCVAKTARGDEQRRLALALQQRVGGHRGAHLHALDLLTGNRLARLQAQQMPDPGDRRIPILLGVLRQQLVRHDLPIGLAPHHIGKCASTIYPELPALTRHLHSTLLGAHAPDCLRSYTRTNILF